MESKNSSLLVVVLAVAVGIPMSLIILLAILFQDEQDRAVATDCAGGSGSGAIGGDMLAPPGSFIKPVDPSLVSFTSGFGERWGEEHQGIDLAGPIGTPIYAAADGTVVDAGPASGFGQWVVLDHVLGGQLFSTVYGHIDTYLVDVGQQVRAGQQIATIGNRGESTGPHLHWETWPGGRVGGSAVDPTPQYDTAPAPGQTPDAPDAPALSDPDVADLAQAPLVSAGAAADCTTAGGGVGDALAAGSVPPEFAPWISQAGGLCPQITPSLLAAQLQAENGFRYGDDAPVSYAGAGGPAQFMPATWASYGADYDGDGTVDINSIGDAVIAQGHYMCSIAGQVDAWIADGSVTAPNGPTELYLAGYNAR